MDEVLITVPTGSYVPILVKRAIECSVRTEDEAQSVSAATKPSIEQASIEPPKRESRLLRGIMIGAVFILLAAVVMASIAESDNPVLKQAFTSGDGPTILVDGFTTDGQTKVPDEVLSGLTNAIVANLVKLNGPIVIVQDGTPDGNRTNPTYTLRGSVRLEKDDMRAIARLVRAADGSVVWSSDYDVNIKGRSILDVQAAIARSISAAVAAPFGAGATSRPQG
ncbi:hypothetical protein [Rhizobium altiplani]|nr:hypothetical protein [Rhizobium altiplani]